MAKDPSKKFLKRAFVKTVLRRTFALVTLVGLIYGFTAVVYATRTIFKVKMNYAVVLERFGGRREAVTRTVLRVIVLCSRLAFKIVVSEL